MAVRGREGGGGTHRDPVCSDEESVCSSLQFNGCWAKDFVYVYNVPTLSFKCFYSGIWGWWVGAWDNLPHNCPIRFLVSLIVTISPSPTQCLPHPHPHPHTHTFEISCLHCFMYRKPGWLWTSQKIVVYFIFSYHLHFPRIFLYDLLRQYINIINDYNLLV